MRTFVLKADDCEFKIQYYTSEDIGCLHSIRDYTHLGEISVEFKPTKKLYNSESLNILYKYKDRIFDKISFLVNENNEFYKFFKVDKDFSNVMHFMDSEPIDIYFTRFLRAIIKVENLDDENFFSY